MKQVIQFRRVVSMAAEVYVAKCLKMKLKIELLSLGKVLGVPLRKSWTKGRMVGSITGRYEEKPEILFFVLSRESAEFLRKHLRNPAKQGRMKDSIYRELEFLGLVEKWKDPVEKKKSPVEKMSGVLEEGPDFLFEGSGTNEILLERKQAGMVRRLDEMEKVVRGMLRCFGMLDKVDLTDMAARKCLERDGMGGHANPSAFEDFRREMEILLRCRLGLQTFFRTYEEGGRTYLLHPSVTNPERLRYRIQASPVKDYREFTFDELLGLGEGEETSGAAYLGLLDLLGKHPYKEKERMYRIPADDALIVDSPYGARPEEDGRDRNRLKKHMKKGKNWEEDILHIKLRIREGAPNLEIVREVMERLSFEDHQEVSHFLERFISHCDDIPRWNLKGYRMNEI